MRPLCEGREFKDLAGWPSGAGAGLWIQLRRFNSFTGYHLLRLRLVGKTLASGVREQSSNL